MNVLAQLLQGFSSKVTLRPKLARSEPVRSAARPMTGFLALLTEDQRKDALAYRGEDSHGSDEFLRTKK